eukprot:m.158091 g.158091  ORF g.158091 m.158091 type:complete len:122 (-) comp17979_c0_seq12:1661-2026(-)
MSWCFAWDVDSTLLALELCVSVSENMRAPVTNLHKWLFKEETLRVCEQNIRVPVTKIRKRSSKGATVERSFCSATSWLVSHLCEHVANRRHHLRNNYALRIPMANCIVILHAQGCICTVFY